MEGKTVQLGLTKRVYADEVPEGIVKLTDPTHDIYITCTSDSAGNVLKIYTWTAVPLEGGSVRQPVVTVHKISRFTLIEYKDLLCNENLKTLIRDHDFLLYYRLWPSKQQKTTSFQESSPPEESPPKIKAPAYTASVSEEKKEV